MARSTKQSLDWHRQCRANMDTHVRTKHAEMLRATEAYERAARDLVFYSEQIATAATRGLKAFDRDRFLVKRKTK